MLSFSLVAEAPTGLIYHRPSGENSNFQIHTAIKLICEIQRLRNKFIWLALRLPKYISANLLHDSSGLPYVKNRLL